MPTRPIKLPPRGQTIRSGPTLSVLDERSRRVAQLTGSYPIEVIRSTDGFHVRDVRLPPFWVLITRRSTSGSSVPSYHYSGKRLYVNRHLELEPETTGYFDRETYPLIEMSENPNVPDNAVVYATPGTGRTHYEFLWSVGSGVTCDDTGDCTNSNTCCVRIADMFRMREDGGCELRDACLCLTPNGLEIRDNTTNTSSNGGGGGESLASYWGEGYWPEDYWPEGYWV